jgi:hypothetical protein
MNAKPLLDVQCGPDDWSLKILACWDCAQTPRVFSLSVCDSEDIFCKCQKYETWRPQTSRVRRTIDLKIDENGGPRSDYTLKNNKSKVNRKFKRISRVIYLSLASLGQSSGYNTDHLSQGFVIYHSSRYCSQERRTFPMTDVHMGLDRSMDGIQPPVGRNTGLSRVNVLIVESTHTPRQNRHESNASCSGTSQGANPAAATSTCGNHSGASTRADHSGISAGMNRFCTSTGSNPPAL